MSNQCSECGTNLGAPYRSDTSSDKKEKPSWRTAKINKIKNSFARSNIFVAIIVLSSISLLACVTVVCYKSLEFDANIGTYAEGENTAFTDIHIEHAVIAMSRLEERGLTSGNTGIFVETLGDDLGVWYREVKGLVSLLSSENSKTSNWAKVNLGAKFGNPHGEPSGISRYPYNVHYAAWFWGSLLFLGVAVFCAIYRDFRSFSQ